MTGQIKKKLSTDRFVNPYTFYPGPDKKVSYEEYEDKKEYLTGKITVEIKTKTPLFIPHSGTEKAFKVPNAPEEHKSYDFFTYSEAREGMPLSEKNTAKPVIPGSEIRGMIRSVYEALTDSCFSAVNEDALLYKRTNDYYKPALIRKERDGRYYLMTDSEVRSYKLNFNKMNGLEELNDGQKVFFSYKKDLVTITLKNGRTKTISQFKVTDISKQKRDKLKEGFLIKGEPGPSGLKNEKSNYIVISPQPVTASRGNAKTVSVSLSKEALDSLEHVLSSYKDERVNKHMKKGHKGYQDYAEAWEVFKAGNEGYFPVYASQVGSPGHSYYYLSPACITKEAYQNSIGKILKNHGNLKPCSDPSDLCPACSLFGMVAKHGTKASSIRFGDAKCAMEIDGDYSSCYMDPVTLQELSQPKVSSTEFYLIRPEDAELWTYDYKVVYDEDGKLKLELCSDEVKIAGRKFYWHSRVGEDDKVFFPQTEVTERNKTVRPVKSNITFTEDIYFDRISRTQLDQLLMILNMSSEEKMGYKLGSGKPLGLGSITMNVTGCDIRIIELDEESKSIVYSSQKYEDYFLEKMPVFDSERESYEQFHFEKDNVDLLLRIADFHAADGFTVTYPVTQTQLRAIQSGEALTEGFKWSVANKGGKIVRRNQMKYKASLPKLTKDGDISLPAHRG